MSGRVAPHPKKDVAVLDQRMSYVELGDGDRVVLFLHGNPTSSYLWRNVMPALAPRARCIAPDLIGMGDSSKLRPGDGAYRYDVHRNYLWRFIDEVVPRSQRVTLVLHDWGSALGFEWAHHHRDRVDAIVYMEAIVRPLEWSEWPDSSRPLFQALRSDSGESLILDRNVFIERILPGSILRPLSAQEMDEYRRPFSERHHRWPMLAWPRALTVGGEPIDVVQVVQDYSQWMATNDIPKLFVNAEPGAILVGAQREFCRRWPCQTEVTVKGSHFLQEDSGAQIGQAISNWMG